MRLVALTVAWLCGIWLGHILWLRSLLGCQTPKWPAAILAAALLCGLFFRRSRPDGRYLALFLLTLLGVWRYQWQPMASCASGAGLAYPGGGAESSSWVALEGVVAGYPDVRDTQTYYRLEVDRLTEAGQARTVRAAVLVQLPREPAWRYGDRLRVTGLLEAPVAFENFDYPAYLARQGIYSIMRRGRAELVARDQGSPVYALLYRIRDAGAGVIDRSLPEPAAALANGMLLGIESGIPPELNQAFKDTGTSHVIVISGSNIALFSGLLLAILGRWFGPRRAALPAIAAIALYVLLVGGGAAPVRAGLMGVLYVIAIIFGRQSMPLVLLAASALVMTAVDPRTFWDTGFQLSVLATLGLILFVPGLQTRLNLWLNGRLPANAARKAAGFAGDLLVVTLAAQITTLPFMIANFGRISLISLLANFLILPAQPPILVSGLVMLAAGIIWSPLARLAAPIPWLFLTYTASVVTALSHVPLATLDAGAWGPGLAMVSYLALATFLGFRWLSGRGYLTALARWLPSPRRQLAAWCAALAIPALLAAMLLGGRPDGRLHLYFLPGSGGEAALIVTPTGQSCFIWNGKGDGEALAAMARSRASGWGRTFELSLGTVPPAPGGAIRTVDPASLAPGQRLQLEAGVTLTRLAAGAEWALLLNYGDFRVLLPTTISLEGQTALAAGLAGQGITVLKAPASGTGVWPGEELLAAAHPQLVLWPLDTTYPPAAAGALADYDAPRVDPEAVVEVQTDGRQLWWKQWSDSAR